MKTLPISKLKMNQLVTIVGNRPQFIKMTAVNKEIERRQLYHIILHTGQHYDHQMSGVFFDELSIRKPDIQLTLRSSTHGAMTGELLKKIEKIFIKIKPRGVLLYGDTNSTLAAALAAVKMGIPVAHVESGPRLGDFDTPEEVNRLIADHISTLRFTCDEPSVQNLRAEGITKGVINTGDVMYDVFLDYASKLSNTLAPKKGNTIYMTLHRPQNVDERDCHLEIIDFIKNSDANVIFPLHARTKTKINEFGLMEHYLSLKNLQLSGPFSYLESVASIMNSDFVITDSGGLQKEAYFAGKLAMLMLQKTPWPELKESGWLTLGGWVRDGGMLTNFQKLRKLAKPTLAPKFFGTGNSSAIIVDSLIQNGLIGCKL